MMKGFTDKIARFVLLIAVCAVIVLSMLALVSVHITLFEQSFLWSSEGLNNYLEGIFKYKELFVFTITVITVYIGFQSWKTASANQKDRLRQDHFSEWKAAIEYRFSYTDKNDPLVRSIFTTARWKIFDELYNFDLKIMNKEQLEYFFSRCFKELMGSLEEQNESYKMNGGIYKDEKHVYSYESLRWIILGCLHDYYSGFEEDLKQLMIEHLPPNRYINEEVWIEKEMANSFSKAPFD